MARDGKHEHAVAQILEAINYGNLSPEETVKRLKTLVDAEICKTDHPCDLELIDACEDLIYEINTQGRIPFDSRMESNRKKVFQKLKRDFGRKNQMKILWRMGVAAASLILVFGGVLLSKYQWIGGHSSINEQQYVIQGQEIGESTIQNSIAEHNGIAELTTTNWNNVIAFLGFEPVLPDALQNNWKVKEYYVLVSIDRILLSTVYAKGDGQLSIRFSLEFYLSVDEAYTSFEQNKEGTLEQFKSTNIYVSKNVDQYTLTWLDDLCIYRLAGNVIYDELFKIASEIIGDSVMSYIKLFCIIFTMILVLSIGTAYATEVVPYADPVFDSITISLSSRKDATFMCFAYDILDTIKVTDCWLQEKVSNTWRIVCDLTPPDKESHNSHAYAAMMDYASEIGTGTFRIGATFYADGHETIRYSNARTF